MQNFAFYDGLTMLALLLVVLLLCVFITQLKRHGQSDKQSMAARSYMLTVTFISGIICVPLVRVLAPQTSLWLDLLAIAICLAIGVITKKIYDQFHKL